jgi:DNA-binding HxlR family transcriptional regulator
MEDVLHELLGRKWTARVLLALREEPRGFAELERTLGVTPKPLAERLEALRCRGFVTRHVHATSPPSTTYRLTERGTTFADRLAGLADLVSLVDCDCGSGEVCAVPAGPDEAACCAPSG